MTTITKEWLQQTIAGFENTRDDIPFGLSDDDAKMLIVLKRALASLTAEPVAWTDAEELRDLRTVGFCEMFTVEPVSKDADMYRVIPLYTDSPVPERERIRREHAEWSDATFGGVGPVGPLKHLSKEALEAAADPSDPLEWADMQFLMWDAQRRAGITDKQITLAMVEKLEINKSRQWPEPKDGEPRLHIKEQPASVVPEEKRDDDGNTTSESDHGWNACRTAMLQGSQPVSNHDELQVIGWLRSDYNSDDKRDHNAPLFMLVSNDPSEAWGVKYIPLSGNSPVIPGVYLADINTDHQH
ncbi:TPA: DUF550 domain-containing protein [Salmonella enterica]|uniref:DUF550 domain-containing protein n=1 Tax=Salmonella enterica TaxID=28901 RepID=UPI001CECE091|nr:DUF550 domain-containing protein [Salmonella enterica]MDQ6492351.1 DUF550 domain-containing protein [Salmonella enterica]MDQ6536542.1 DUF550 domain-containing protein [Salmonella enterica]MDV2064276.1 DUF550 domain-containing protein [Salmonella enterica]